MKYRASWRIALVFALLALAATGWRALGWRERAYRAYIEDCAQDAILLLQEDPLAMRAETQALTRVVAGAAAMGELDTPYGRYILAMQHQREGERDKAEAVLRAIIEERPEWSWPYALLGSILGRYGSDRLEEAEAVLRQAIALEPYWSRPYNSLGVVLRQLGRYEEAEEAALRAVELAPDDIAAHNNYANLLVVLGWYDEAEVQYLEALRLEPNNSKPMYNLACLYSAMGKTDDALAHLEEAIYLNRGLRNDAALEPLLAPLHGLSAFDVIVYGAVEQQVAGGEHDAQAEVLDVSAEQDETPYMLDEESDFAGSVSAENNGAQTAAITVDPGWDAREE